MGIIHSMKLKLVMQMLQGTQQAYRRLFDPRFTTVASPEDIQKRKERCQHTMDVLLISMGKLYRLKKKFGRYPKGQLVELKFITPNTTVASVVPHVYEQEVSGFHLDVSLLEKVEQKI